jgi:hypothetical protein
MDLDTPETCRGWRNILRICCASSWFFFTRLYRDSRSKKHKNPSSFLRTYQYYNNFILIYIQQDAKFHSSIYLETALHVSGGTTTHHQEGKQLYLQHLVFVTPLLVSAAIVEELEPAWACCGWFCAVGDNFFLKFRFSLSGVRFDPRWPWACRFSVLFLYIFVVIMCYKILLQYRL